jgi:5-methylcytosine-specific restriction enzyme subunit McrC
MSIVELQEWQDTFLPKIVLSTADQRLVKSLYGVEIREMRDGVYIKAASWIGVVRFDAFTLRIRPKLTNIDIMRMLLVAGGLERLRRYRATRDYELRDIDLSLFDLVALLLADACTLIAKDGLLRGYVIEEEDLSVVRGSLRIAEQIRRRYGQVNRLECRYDEHNADIIENRILHTALALCRRYVQHPLVRNRIQRLLDTFAAASQPLDGDWQVIRSETNYNRLNSHYQEAHSLAWIVMEGLNVQDILATGSTRGFTFLLNMNPLFEKFVEVLVRSVLHNEPIDIQTQVTSTGHIWDVAHNQTYKRIRPDLLVVR